MPADLHQTRMATAAEPPFHAEIEAVWGRPWGAHDEVGRLRAVLVRPPGPALSRIGADGWDPELGALVDPDGGWYWTRREPPDRDRAEAQHRGLVALLESEGIEVMQAHPMSAGYTKAMYVRDPLVTVPGGAIVTRMAVRMRRGEEADITRTVADAGLPVLATLTGTATLEGGSFIKLRDGTAALGTSIRCNSAGADQMRAILHRLGWELVVVPLPGYTIHLDLHLAMLDLDLALIDPAGLPYDFLTELQGMGIELISADPGEEWGLNLLALAPRRVLMAQGSPRTAERLIAAGVEVLTVPYDEIQPNGGGVHCSTMELIREPAR
ncbi:MAG: arginine deiminase family protein [Actinomycetota bacterium]|nr:arginine deiminase family protein [Actinomycetota bacterium]